MTYLDISVSYSSRDDKPKTVQIHKQGRKGQVVQFTLWQDKRTCAAIWFIAANTTTSFLFWQATTFSTQKFRHLLKLGPVSDGLKYTWVLGIGVKVGTI